MTNCFGGPQYGPPKLSTFKQMKKTVFTLLFLFSTSLVFAQKTSSAKPFIKGQFNLSLSGYNPNNHVGPKAKFLVGPKAEFLYGHNDYLEVGVFCNALILTSGDGNHLNYPIYLNYGAVGKAHLFPAVIKPSFHYIDLYAVGKLGAGTIFPNGVSYITRGTGLYYSIGAGAAINLFSRHFGLFYEIDYGRGKLSTNTFGINIRFGGPKKWQKNE